MDAREPVVPVADSGTGKSHLLIGLGLAACEQGRRVRYVTSAQLVKRTRNPVEFLTPEPGRECIRSWTIGGASDSGRCRSADDSGCRRAFAAGFEGPLARPAHGASAAF